MGTVASHGHGLEPRRLPRNHRNGRFRHAERLREQRGDGRIGPASFRHGGDAQAQDREAVAAYLEAFDPVGTRIGRDAQLDNQAGGRNAPGAQ